MSKQAKTWRFGSPSSKPDIVDKGKHEAQEWDNLLTQHQWFFGAGGGEGEKIIFRKN